MKGLYGLLIVLLVASMLVLPLLQEPQSSTVQDSPTPSTPLDYTEGKQYGFNISPSNPSFTENLGQSGEGAGLFYFEGRPTSVSLGQGWIAYYLWNREPNGEVNGVLIRIHFLDGNKIDPFGLEPTTERRNFLLGDDPHRWITGVRTFAKVIYREIWDGIDLQFYFKDDFLKYDFIVHPGADPQQISMRIEGQDSIRINNKGSLVISTPLGEILDGTPLSFYDDQADERVECDFILLDPQSYTFQLDCYDTSRTIIIDPLVYSTYFGGTQGFDLAWDITVDAKGCAYVTGETHSTNFPVTPGAYQSSQDASGGDAYISKLNSNGSALVFSTLLGGSGRDFGRGLEIDNDGSIVVGGSTSSGDFPAYPGALQSSGYGFLCRLSADGSRLLFSTYAITGIGDICLDGDSNIYVTGVFAMNGTYGDIQVSKISSNGAKVLNSKMFGTGGDDRCCGIAVDNNNDVYVVGRTDSDNFPVTSGAFQTSRKGREDLYIFKLTSDFSAFEYATYFGGSYYEHPYDIVVDDYGHVYITGDTRSNDFPTSPGAYQRSLDREDGSGGGDAFVSKISADGSSIEYSTYIGGKELDVAFGIDVDENGHAFIIGKTVSSDFPVTVGALQPNLNSSGYEPKDDAFVCMINYNGSSLHYSSYIGGNNGELGYDVHVDVEGSVFLAGRTQSSNFPTTSGAFRTIVGEGEDAFILKLVPDISYTTLKSSEGPRLYAGYKDYHFLIDANPLHFSNPPYGVQLILDPEFANVTLAWRMDESEQPFHIVNDQHNYVKLVSDTTDIIFNRLNRTLLLDFRIVFNWTWPHELPCDVRIELIDNKSKVLLADEISGFFSVENDLDFHGDVSAIGHWQGNLSEGDWVRGGEAVTLMGPIVVYEGTMDVYPPDDICNVTIHTSSEKSNMTALESGIPLALTLEMGDQTNRDEQLTMTLKDLPGTATIVSNRTFRLKVDGDLPRFRNAIPEDEDWHSCSDVLISITVDDSGTSGVDATTVEYGYSTDGPLGYGDWTQAGLAVTSSGEVVDGLVTLTLPDGDMNFIRWRAKDRVGNGYSISPDLRIKVDTRNVTFSDPVPDPDGWLNYFQVLCGVTIRDVEGSGIDVSTIQFRFSLHNLSNYIEWEDWDEGNQGDDKEITTRTSVEFKLSTYNYIQWRAMDIAGNGYTTSPHYRVKVDISPIEFSDFLPTRELIHNQSQIMCWVNVLDDIRGSGVNLSSIEYRHGLVGENSSPWIPVGMDGAALDVRFSLIAELPDGFNNSIQFRGCDMAGNGPTPSLRYLLRVDTTGPELINITLIPAEESTGLEYTATVTVWDALSGVNDTSIRYRLGNDEDGFTTDWNHLDVHQIGELFEGSVIVTLQRGRFNFVEFNAFDLVGNEAWSESAHIWVNTPPIAVISSPLDGWNYSESDIISIRSVGSRDPDGGQLNFTWSVSINGSIQFTETGEEFDIQFEPGEYVIKLLVEDADGDIDTTSVLILVLPLPPPRIRETDNPSLIIILLLILFIIVSLVLVFYLRTRQALEE